MILPRALLGDLNKEHKFHDCAAPAGPDHLEQNSSLNPPPITEQAPKTPVEALVVATPRSPTPTPTPKGSGVSNGSQAADPISDGSQAAVPEGAAEPISDGSQASVPEGAAKPISDGSQAAAPEPISDGSQAAAAELISDGSQAAAAELISDGSRASLPEGVAEQPSKVHDDAVSLSIAPTSEPEEPDDVFDSRAASLIIVRLPVLMKSTT